MAYNWSFTYATFINIFKDLSKISEDQFTFYKKIAPIYIDISYYFGDLSIDEQNNMAMLVVAHLLSLSLRGANGGVGPISNASEGSVSVGFQGLKNMNWWTQTPYGALLWNILSRYTTPFLVSGDGCWM